MPTFIRCCALLLLSTTAANAQIRLPALPPISLPAQPLQGAGQILGQTESRALDRLSDLRHLEISRLRRANRGGVDVDGDGQPIVRSEILALALSDAALAQARSAGFTVAREQSIDSVGIHLTVLTAPEGMSTQKALRRLRDADPNGVYDFNHIYLGGGNLSEVAGNRDSVTAAPASTAPVPAGTTVPRPKVRIGLLDTGVDISHPAFTEAVIHSWGCEGKPVPAAHGTAVASLLVGRAEYFHGVQPGAELYAADVYCGKGTGGAVDALVAAFGWMIEEGIPVINISLVGPNNAMLRAVVAKLIGNGFVIVAAVGNDGPAAPPLYPASYPNVVGVTAVDARHRILIEAARGPQVMFASIGADTAAAGADHGYVSIRGTSFAAPIVAGLLAAQMAAPDARAAATALQVLRHEAIDLGSPGLDLTYGYGLVGGEFRVEPALLLHR